MNPLDWRGPEFLALYVVAIVAVTAVAFALKAFLGPRAALADSEADKLHPYEIGLLAGGWAGVVGAAVTSLVHRGRVIAGDKRLLWLGPAGPDKELVAQGVFRGYSQSRGDHPVESRILTALANGGRTLDSLRSTVSQERTLESALVQKGLYASPGARAAVRFAIVGLTLPVVALGIAKVGVGVARDRPIGFLVLLMFVAIAAGFVHLVFVPKLTGRGKALVSRLRDRFYALDTTARSSIGQLGAADVALAAGLFGAVSVAALYPPGWVPLHASMWSIGPQATGSTWTSSGCGSSGGSSCGSSSCGGGSSCSGGSSCGGGGCGGCGG